jgi:nucleotide-binding universal stress UspA family protein
MNGGTVLCGVDGSGGATDALQVAAALSERLGLRMVIAHIGGADAGESGVRVVAEAIAQARTPIPIEHRLASGDPADRLAVIAVEEGADLIVIGAGGRPRRRRTDIPALVVDLESATSCPVLVAPRQTRNRSGSRLTCAHRLTARQSSPSQSASWSR